MKYIFFLLFFNTGIQISFAQYQQRNLLTNTISNDQIKSMVNNLPDWRLNTKRIILDKLNNLSLSAKDSLIKDGQKYLNFTWPSLAAYDYLGFVRDGNRSDFQNKYSERRIALYKLVLAELVENKDRFMPQIVNGLWAICEESTWCYPAHIYAQGVEGLPDPNQNIIDIGASETSLNLSWILFMMENSLQKISPVIPEKIQFELKRRIIDPYLKIDFWWMGFPNKKVNNWNIWLNRNCLYTVVLLENNSTLAETMIERILHSADNFMNSYGDDGGCEEGTHYWEAAPGYMIQFLDLLKGISKDKIDFSGVPLIQKMGEYIYKMHIDKGNFVNFADASPRPNLSPAIIYNYGKATNDSVLMKFASYLAVKQNFSKTLSSGNHLFNYFTNLMVFKDIFHTEPKAPFIESSWFPDLEMMTARDNEGNSNGLFIAAKGGNNGVSHGHNDVGTFIVYVDGNPAIIDAGVGTYTAQTFNSERYTIWTMQSGWHNVPIINGFQQKEGSAFKATGSIFSSNKKSVVFKTDISKAYPKNARIKSWVRSLTLIRNKKLLLEENYNLEELIEPFNLIFMTPLKVELEKEKILLTGVSPEGKKYGLVIKYNSNLFNVKIETKILEDEKLIGFWGQGIQRILFTSKQNTLKGRYRLEFEKL